MLKIRMEDPKDKDQVSCAACSDRCGNENLRVLVVAQSYFSLCEKCRKVLYYWLTYDRATVSETKLPKEDAAILGAMLHTVAERLIGRKTSKQHIVVDEASGIFYESNLEKSHEYPEAGTFCSVCLEPQFETPSGITCSNGHGGADSLETPNQTKKSKIDFSDNDVCSCESLPGEDKFQYVSTSSDGMMDLYRCRFCGKEVLV